MPASLVQRFRYVFTRAFIGGGLAFALVAVGFAIHTSLFLRAAQSTSGTVIQFHTMTDEQGGDVTYAPIFQFVARDNTTYTITSTVGSNPPQFAVGQRVNLLYDKSNPGNAKIDSVGQLWFFPILFGIIGPVFASAGIVALRIDRHRTSQAAAATR